MYLIMCEINLCCEWKWSNRYFRFCRKSISEKRRYGWENYVIYIWNEKFEYLMFNKIFIK